MNHLMNGTHSQNYTVFQEYIVAVWLWTIFPPILIVAGTIGNIVAIVVLNRKSMQDSTVSVYLSALAAVDVLVLWTGLLRGWIKIVFNVDVRLISEMVCKIHLWIVYFALSMSSWLLVAVTVERFLSVWVPHKVKTYCSKFTASVTIVTMTITLLVLCSHVMYGLGDVIITSEGVTSYKRCEELWADYSYFLSRVWPLIALLHFSLVPFVLLFVANLSIICKVIANARRFTNVISELTSQQCRVQTRKHSSMTLTLLSLNAIFLVCTLPECLFLIVKPGWSENATPHMRAQLCLIEAVVDILMYTNNALNFFLYCACGSRFRATLKTLFRRKKCRQTKLRHPVEVYPLRSLKTFGSI